MKGGTKEVYTTRAKIEPQPGTEIRKEGPHGGQPVLLLVHYNRGKTHNPIFTFDCTL